VEPPPPPLETLRLEGDGPVARLVLARGPKRNAMSPRMLEELAAAAAWLDGRDAVRTVVVAAEGPAFCGGFDLGAMAAYDTAAAARAATDLGRRMAEAVATMRPVSVAAIEGACVGGGVVLAAACDLRVAAGDARFSIPEVDLGIPLAWGGIPRLVREIGPARTRDLVMTCRAFDAAEAASIGLVQRVVPAGAAMEAAGALAAELAAKSGLVLAQTKAQVAAAASALAPTDAAALDADLLVSALQDVERGRPKNLSSLLDEVAARAALKPSAQEAERLRLEVSSLRSEATRLRDRLRVAEEEVDRARRAAGHDVR